MDIGFDKRSRCLQVLELSHGASEDEIKKAYKSMALRYHPDKNSSPDANVKFQEISAAYNYLMEGDDYLRRIEHEDGNLFDIIINNLFSWLFHPQPSYGGAFNMNNFYFDDDEEEYEEDYDQKFSYTFEPSRRWQSPSSNMYRRNFASPHGFRSHSSAPPDHHFTFTNANVQHGQYFHETKQARQSGKSSKRLNKDARMARKENNESDSGKSHSSSPLKQNQSRATSPSEKNKRQAGSPSRQDQRSPTPVETQNRKEAKEASSSESMKTENLSTKKSKKQIKAEQKQREQEMSEIRQQLQVKEEERKRQSEERRIAQELKDQAEREIKEEENRKEEERLRIEQEAAKKKMEEEKREKAKKAAETKKRTELLRKFESNPFLNEDGSFQSSDSDLMNIIRTETYSEAPAENSEKVESINGIPVSDLARLQNLTINRHSDGVSKQRNDTVQGKEANPASANQPKTRVRNRSRSRNARKSATRSELGSGPSVMPNGFNATSMNFNQGNFQQQQQHPFHQHPQNQRHPTPYVNRPPLHQPCPRIPLYPGPTLAPPLPPPQLNRPPPPLRFPYRPSFPRQSSSSYSASGFPNQRYKMNAF